MTVEEFIKTLPARVQLYMHEADQPCFDMLQWMIDNDFTIVKKSELDSLRLQRSTLNRLLG